MTLSYGLTPQELAKLEKDMPNWVLPRILEQKAEKNREKIFLNIMNERSYTYLETNQRANQVARYLQRMGVRKGDKVAVLLPNNEHYIFSWFGIHKLGAVQVPVNTAYKMDFLQYALDFSDSKILITDANYLERVIEIQEKLPKLEGIILLLKGEQLDTFKKVVNKPLFSFEEAYNEDKENLGIEVMFSDPERIMFTSGTTGRSKGVFRAHAAAYWTAYNYIRIMGINQDDVLLTCLPLFHANAQVVCIYPALLADASVAVYERFSATHFWDWCRQSKATIFNLLGAMCYFLFNQPERPDDRDNSVRLILAAPSPRDIYHKFCDRFGIKITEGYGLTETGVVTYMPPDNPRIGSIGIAAPGYEVKIVDEHDREVPPGTPGEIVVRNQLPWLMVTEYYKMPEKTVSDFRNLWFHTGDGGKMDEDGYFYFVDRIKDYIRRRGENISSFEVEKVINLHPQVKESAVIAIPSSEGVVAEDEVMAVIVARDGVSLSPEELAGWCSKRMPYFMVPRYIRFVPQLPKTPTERVQKNVLRDIGVTDDTWDRQKAGFKIQR